MTTNCLVPPKDSYKERVYTTSVVGFPGVKHVTERQEGQAKDFLAMIEHAKKCAPPTEIETGAIKNFFVMAGCDGRMKSREYFCLDSCRQM